MKRNKYSERRKGNRKEMTEGRFSRPRVKELWERKEEKRKKEREKKNIR